MRNRIARIDLTTGLADSFDPNASGNVYSIALQSDGKILAGGVFGSIGGQIRTGFARLSNDTAAFSTLNVTQSSVSLTTDGSTALFSRVTFELSTDNGANYSFLGSVTPSLPASAPADRRTERGAPAAPQSAGYTLSGLDLPIAQNILIRARGRFASGSDNDSESLQEKVQNAFLPPVLKILSISRSANGHIMLQCLGAPNQVNNLEVSPDLSPGSFVTISPAPAAADGTGAFSYDDAGAVGLTKRFYRLSFP